MRLARIALLALLPLAAAAAPPPVTELAIDVSHPVASFRPSEAFGAAFDGGGKDESKPLLAPANRAAVLAVAPPRGSYRLRTELAIQAWHWSALGRWSDPAHARGYWTGDADRDDPSPVSWGYRLPRRGDTNDEANDDGWSRLDDGDPATFWKSNPYLDARYTGLPGERAEWVKVDLGAATPVDAVELAWAEPYARRFRVQHWEGTSEETGRWVDFPHGVVEDGRGGFARLRLADRPTPVRYVRLRLELSSHTAAPDANAGAPDPRDALGYALRELKIGRLGPDGSLIDAVIHAPSKKQTLVYVSSTDPWHRAEDRDPQVEQPSPLEIVRAGVSGTAPLMIPVGAMYDTPENALAELAYLRRRGLKLHQVELGEEPDGQRVTPEDYAALYVPLARDIHARWPELVTGGPSLVGGFADTWLEEGPTSFTQRFVAQLKAEGALDRLGFYSFEFYPFEEFCGPASAKVAALPGLFDRLFARHAADGVPATTPRIISEYGFSAFSARLEVEPPSALFTISAAADFLARGGSTAFIYGFAPNHLETDERPCADQGNMMLWLADDRDRARWPMPSYYGWRALTREWVAPGDGLHALFTGEAAGAHVTAHAVRQPDGRWAVLLMNRGDTSATVRLAFQGGGPGAGGAVDGLRWGPDRYRWSIKAAHPLRDKPPEALRLPRWDAPLTLPPLSFAVLRDAR